MIISMNGMKSFDKNQNLFTMKKNNSQQTRNSRKLPNLRKSADS